MHYLGFVIVKEPTKEAIDAAMAKHRNDFWDWYRPGGRWDGFLIGKEEMKSRSTHDGFKSDDSNESIDRNCCRVSDLPKDKTPYFFVVNGEWIAKEYYDQTVPNLETPNVGSMVEMPDFDERFRSALARHKDEYIVVVDVHN